METQQPPPITQPIPTVLPTQPSSIPTPPTTFPPLPQEPKKTNPLKIILLLVALILIFGIGFMFYSILTTPTGLQHQILQPSPAAEEAIIPEEEETTLTEESDEVGDIEKDLNATDLSNLDQELKDIDKELVATP